MPGDLIPGLGGRPGGHRPSGDRTDQFPSVCIDNEAAARLVVGHLIELVHERIGLVGGQTDAPIHFDVPDLRLRGAARRHEGGRGRHWSPRDVQTGGVHDHRRLPGDEPQARPPPAADRGVAFSDEMAIGAMRAVRDHGLRVPEDVSIAGFDDHEISWSLDLTTVAQPVVGLGESVAQLLLDRLDGREAEHRHLVYDVQLVERNSTGRVPVAVAPVGS